MPDGGTWRLPPLRSGHPASDELEARRRRAAGSTGEAAAVEMIGGVRCLVVGPAGARRTILYFHGGGYRMGGPEAWAAYAGRVAAAAEARIVLPAYRLAPEHPFPAALHDAAAVYRALGLEAAPLIAGDSAGGGLACALALAAEAAGRPAAGAILVSPMLDLMARDPSYETHRESDRIFSREAVLDCAALYLQGQPADDPLVSPLLAEPGRFPPMLVLAGGAEVLLGEALAFTRALALAGRPVTLHVAAGMGHVWPMLAPDTVEAGAAVAVMAGFAKAVMG